MTKQMNGHDNVIDLTDHVYENGLTGREIRDFLAKMDREMTPRMRRWAVALELIEKGYWPRDPQFELLDTALDVVLAIRDDSLNALWLSLRILPTAQREAELDRMAQNPKLREWLALYRDNIRRAEDAKREWAKRREVAS
jgi:hypothetical protein